MKILALHLQSFIEFAQVRGIDRDELIARTAIPALDLSAPHATVEAGDFYLVLETMHKKLQDEQLGWRIGNFLNLSVLGLIYQISLQATTVEEAIFYLEDFVKATFPLIEIETKLEEEANIIALAISNDKEILNRIILECILVIIARELRMMSTDDIVIKISSPFFNPSYPENFQYGEHYRVEFSHLNLKASLKRFDSAQLNYLVPEYVKLIQGFKNENTVQNKVKIATLNMAKPALPGLEEVAESFHLTPRTFQRMLAREKQTYRKISDDLKKQISVLLLRHNGYSITDVGYLLGYSEPAGFVHSFKKWYGCTPTAHREESRLN